MRTDMKTSLIKISRIAVPSFFVILLIALTSCGQGSAKKGNEEKKQELEAGEKAGLKPGEVMISQKQVDAVGIELGGLEKRNLQNLIKATGFLTLPPQNKASLSVFIGGVVKSIFVKEGDYVKKGQSLALFESPEYVQLQNDFIKAETDFIFLKKEYLRQKELFENNATSQKGFQQTEANFKIAEANYNSLHSKLKLLNIDINKLESGEIVSSIPVISPINGYIQYVGVNIGTYADPLKEIFRVVNNSDILLELDVYLKGMQSNQTHSSGRYDYTQIKAGQKAFFVLPDQKEITGEAEIYAVGKALDESTKSIKVYAKVISKSTEFVPGTFVNGYIEIGQNKVNSLPADAIINEGQNNGVFILLRTINDEKGKEYIFGLREVKVGISEAGFSEVTFWEEPPENGKIAVKGAFFIESEMNKKAEGETD